MLRQGSSVRSTLTAAATHSPQSLVQPISLVQSISIVILESMLSMSFLRACWFRLLESEIALDLSVSVPHKRARMQAHSAILPQKRNETRIQDFRRSHARCKMQDVTVWNWKPPAKSTVDQHEILHSMASDRSHLLISAGLCAVAVNSMSCTISFRLNRGENILPASIAKSCVHVWSCWWRGRRNVAAVATIKLLVALV